VRARWLRVKQLALDSIAHGARCAAQRRRDGVLVSNGRD
jgi:hypothetical protein